MNCFFFKNKSKSPPELPKGRKKKTQVVNGAPKSPSTVPSLRSIKELYKEKEQSYRIFSLKELVDATNGFNRMLKIGEGGFGKVYRGTISEDGADPIVAAIKKLNNHGLQVLYTHPFFTTFLFLVLNLNNLWFS